MLTNAFSAEYGWTSGPALELRHQVGHAMVFTAKDCFCTGPGSWQAETFPTKNFCPPSVSTCVTPTTLQAINPVDIPDQLSQVSGTIGGPIVKDKTFFFVTTDYTWQNRTTFLSPTLPTFVLPADGSLDWTGHYRQFLFNGRLDHKLTSKQTLMFRFNIDRFHDDNPQDAVGGTNAPSVARLYARRSWQFQVNHTTVINSKLLNEARFAYLHGDPVTFWTAPTISTTHIRAAALCRLPSASRASQISGVTSSKLRTRCRGRAARITSGWVAAFFVTIRAARAASPARPILGTFTFVTTGPSATLPFDQLTLANVQNYQQPINFGISSYELPQWLLTVFAQDTFRVQPNFTLDLGLRYDRQTLTTATKNFQPRIGFRLAAGQRFAHDDSRRLRDVLHADSNQRTRRLSGERTGWIDDLHGYRRTDRIPDLPDLRTRER